MTELSDADFTLQLNTLQAGDEVSSDLEPADAADLALATKMFQMKAVPSKSLMKNLQSISLDKTVAADRVKHLPMLKIKNRRQFMVGVALSLAALLGLALAYPPTRLAIAQEIEKITFGMITIYVVEPEAIPTDEAGTVVEDYGFVWTPSTIAEIRASYPRFDKVPAWAPAGYNLQDFVALYYMDMYGRPVEALYEWKTTDDHWIQLIIMDNGCPDVYSFEGQDSCGAMYMELESPSFVTVNNESALFYERPTSRAIFPEPIHHWNPGHYRSEDYGLHLYWQSDQRLYMLHTSSKEVSQEDLIHILESIP